jgi:hypothetical protein
MKKTLLGLTLSVFVAVPLLACGDLPQADSTVKGNAATVVAHKSSSKGTKLAKAKAKAKAKAPKPALAATDSKQAKI